MKMKNISVFEKHVEKVFIVLALLVLGVAVWKYVAQKPIQVTVDGQKHPIEATDALLKERADRLKNSLETAAPKPALAKLEVPKYQELLEKRVSERLLSSQPFFPLGPIAKLGRPPVADEEILVNVPKIPAVINPMARAGSGTIPFSDLEIDLDGWSKVFTELAGATTVSSLPRDRAFISIAGTFPVEQLVREFRKPGGRKTRELNSKMYLPSAVGIMAVLVERQEKTGPGDEDWSKSELLDPMPGQFLARALRDKSLITRENYKTWVKRIVEAQSLLAMPAVPGFIGPKWTPPSSGDEGKGLENASEIVKLAAEIKGLKKSISRFDELIKNVKNPPQRKGAPKRNPKAIEARVKSLTRQLDIQKKKLAEAEAKFKELTSKEPADGDKSKAGTPRVVRPSTRVNPKDLTAPKKSPEELAAEARAQELQNLVDQFGGKAMKVTYIDFTAEQGKVYRYRFKVQYINPLYDDLTLLPNKKQIEEMKNKFYLESEWSGWTNEVSVERLSYYFAERNQRRGKGQVKIFRYTHGKWLAETFPVGPGDPVGDVKDIEINGQTVPVDFFTGEYMVDVNFKKEIVTVQGNLKSTRRETEMLLTQGEDLVTRRSDLDKASEKRTELEAIIATQNAQANAGK